VKHRAIVAVVCLLLLVGCGAGGSKSGGSLAGQPDPVANADISGSWNLSLSYPAGNPPDYANYMYVNIFSQGGGNYYSTQANLLICVTKEQIQCEVDQPPNGSATLSATTSGNNVSIQVTETITGNSRPITWNITGSVSGNTMQGSWTDNDATMGGPGTWTATKVTTVAGTYTGTLKDSNGNNYPVTLVVQAGGNNQLNGSGMIQNNVCFSNLNFSSGSFGGNSSFGGAFEVTDNADYAPGGVSLLVLPNSGNQYLVYYSASSNTCQQPGATGTLTKQ
jgi:hypothetical protein